jgi:autotransporter family porin
MRNRAQKISKQNNYLVFTMVLIGLVVIFSYGMGNVSAASGNSIYVNGTSGNNVYNGQSAAYDGTNGPKATIKNATGTVNSNGTIYIAKGTYNESNIQINTNMTIIGENQQNTIINGQQSGHSIFTIASGVYLTIINLTLTNGTSDIGGAIANDGDLNVYNSTFTNNKATDGGAINNGDDGALTVNNSTFNNNTGLYGSVIWNSGDSSTLTNNTFINNNGDYGGVIYNEHTGTIFVTNNTFTNNIAENRGGVIYNYGTSTETNNTFNNNNANGFEESGGAIWNQGTSTVTNNTFNNNAFDGGAIWNQGTITDTSNTFNNNTATDFGGAILNYGTVTDTNNTFNNNTATVFGGAIWNKGTLTETNDTFNNNSAYNGGGAIFNLYTLTETNSTFNSNTVFGNGGAIYNGGNLIVKDSNFINNTANTGGAICDSCTLNVTGSNFIDNTASQGGAIYIDNSPGYSVNVNFNRIVGNTPNSNELYCYGNRVVNATLNWWGLNISPENEISGTGVTYNPWIILTATSNHSTINVGDNSTVTADLLHDNEGNYLDPVNGHVPDGISANFTSDTKGTVNPIISTITNGSANTTFTGLQHGFSVVSAMVDDQTVTTNVNINKISTAITVDPVSGLNGKTVNLTATLTDSDGNPVSGASVQFSVNGTIIGSVNTDTNGIATLPYIITQTNGTYTILANYFGNNTYAASNNTNNLTVNKTPTTIIVTPVSGYKGKTVNLTATLTDSDGNPVNGASLQFSINGTIIGSVNTNTNGIATLPYTITQNGGYYNIDTLFAGDNVYNSSTGSATLKIPQSNIYITVTTSNSHPTVGETVQITFKVGNKGPDTATNVILTLKIPEGMEYVSATTDTGLFTYNPTTRTITWNIGDVPVGDPKLILNTKLLQPGNYTIKPTITTTTYDPNIQSNIGSTTIQVTATKNNTNPVTPKNSTTILNAATTTVPMQHTGVPIAGLILAILMVFGGSLIPKLKK